MKYTSRDFLICLLILIASKNILSQTISDEIVPEDKVQYGISFEKPMYSGNYTNVDPLSGVFQIYFNNPVSSKFAFIGDIPFVNTNYQRNYYNGGYNYNYKNISKGLGNIFIGLKSLSKTPEDNSIISFGVYLPTAVEDASTGLDADYCNMSKFGFHSFTLYFNYAFTKYNTEGLIYGIEAGPTVMIPAPVLYIHYGIQAGYGINNFLVKAELQGFFDLSGTYVDFASRSFNAINLKAEWRTEDISPQIFYRIYLKDYLRDLITGVLGLGVAFTLDK